jgi:hypothetical protein
LLCSFSLFLLASGKFWILKALLFCLYFWLKSRGKEKGSATDHSALLRHNARALANQVIYYIPLIL